MERIPFASRCGYRAPGASKPIARVVRSISATSSGATNRNTALGSMKRRMSHAVAVRLTRLRLRVTQRISPPLLRKADTRRDRRVTVGT